MAEWTSLFARYLHSIETPQASPESLEAYRVLESILNELPIAVFCKDGAAGFRFVIWNRAAETLWGVRQDQVLGKTDADLFSPAQAEYFLKTDQEVLLGGKRVDIAEEAVDPPGGNRVWVRTAKMPMQDRHGKPRYLLGVSEDITEWKRAEETARSAERDRQRSERLLVSILDNTPSLIYAKDAGGRYLVTNRRFEETLGRAASPTAEAAAKAGDAVDDTADEQPAAKARRETEEKVFITRLPTSAEEAWMTPEGKRTFLAITFPLKDVIGRLYGVGGILTDITERAEARKEIEAERSKAITASKMASLGEMAAGIAHEINNPLAIIHGRSTQLQRNADSPTPDLPAIRDIAKKIELTVLRISKIIKGLRAFARDAERDPFELISVRSLIEDTLELCSERFRYHGVALQAPRVSDHLQVFGRPTQLSQVLLNLLGNAFDAVSLQSEKWVRIEVLSDGDYIEIQVSDSGAPMKPEVRERVMEPFFTTKEVGKGTGLGLSISRGIVETHGGTLALADTDRTCFVIRLPRRMDSALAAAS